MTDENLIKRLRHRGTYNEVFDNADWDSTDHRIEQLTAERDRLREALNQSRLAFAGYVSVQSAIDLIDRAVLKGESHD